jgi:centrin-1
MPRTKYAYQQNTARIYKQDRTRKLTPVERLTPEELAEIREAFFLFDVDRSGYMDFRELNFALQSLGIHRKESQVERILNQILDEPTKGLSTKNFVELVATVNLGSSADRDEVREAYRLLGTAEDDEGNPKISLRNLRKTAEEFGQTISDKQLQQMISEAEEQAQGEFDHEEMLKIIKKTSLYYNPLKDR